MEIPAIFKVKDDAKNFTLIGTDLKKFNEFNKLKLVKEKGFDDFSGDKIVISDKFSKKYNVGLGDNVDLQVRGNSKSCTIVAIGANDGIFLGEMDKYMAIIPKETAEKLLNIKDEYTQILLETTEKTKLKPFVNELSNDLSKDYKVAELLDQVELAKQTQSISMPFMLITILVLIMSIFIIYSSFKVITLERLPYIGTFRSVGATEKLVKRILSTKIGAVVKEVKLLYNGKENGTSSLEEERVNNEKTFGVLFGILNGFTYILLFIGIVGLINNLIINFIQRKRSIAMYKSVGLSKNQLIKMTLIEAFTAGAIGGIIGIAISYLEVKIIFKILENFIDINPHYSVSIFVIAALMGMLITLLGSVVPLVKSSKLQIIEAIKYE